MFRLCGNDVMLHNKLCHKIPQIHCVLEESSKWPRKVKFTGKTNRNHVGVIELERPLKKLKETRGKEGNGRGKIYFRAQNARFEALPLFSDTIRSQCYIHAQNENIELACALVHPLPEFDHKPFR